MSWIKEQWGYVRPIHEAKEVLLMLHGTNIGETTGASQKHINMLNEQAQVLYDHCDANSIEILVPDSGAFYTPDNTLTQGWDWVGYYNWGFDLHNLLTIISNIGDKPYTIHGGSSGAIMAWHLAQSLVKMDRQENLQGVAIGDGVSPYCISYDMKPPGTEWIYTENVFSFLGFEYYQLYDANTKLGMINSYAPWEIPTLIQYSRNDPILPEKWKKDFLDTVATRTENLTVHITGYNHDTGVEGWKRMVDWMKGIS